jgi:beta-lactamase regulating signal transducer with metallopeptidase domain
MSLYAIEAELSSGFWDASIGLVVIAKWTVVLALAWLAHGMLARRNPRWRVALWRSAFVGLALVAVLSGVPPIVTYPLSPRDPSLSEIVPTISHVPAVAVRGDSEVDPVRAQRGIPWGRRPSGAEPSHPRSDFPAEVAGVAAGKAGKPAEVPVMVGRNDPATREVQGFRWGPGSVSGLWTIWLAGVLVLTARLIVGSLSLTRLVRRASEAPDPIVRDCREVADCLGCRGSVHVRLTKDIATPCLAGLWRPVLLLPERECHDARPDDLRAILAHELAHARNHDVAWNLVAHLASILLWFHPLAWRIRAAHVAACDAVCDAVAADLLGDVISYGRTLARLAVRAAWPAPAHGLAMARTSDVRRRLEALNRRVFRTPLSWRRVMPAFVVGSVLLVCIGGFGFTRAEQAATTPKSSNADKLADPKAAGKLTLRAVSAETNEPIEGVSIEYRARIDEGKFLEATIMTGEDGTTAIEWPATATVHMLWFTARAPKRVPIYIIWDDARHPINLPPQKELRFEPGTTIGGIVKDEAGQPIEGATVEVSAHPTESERNNSAFDLGSPKTDAQGRWRLDVAPKDLSALWAWARHPRYQESPAAMSRNFNSVTVLKKGLKVTGRVVDAAGRPVRGARASFGPTRFGSPGPPRGMTNDRGEFTLENCEPGPSIITVQAEGFAPQIQDVRVAERTAPIEIRMTDPGPILRVRVADVQGKPVAGAYVVADTWRGHRSIDFHAETDQDGRLAWRSAPKDLVLYNIGHERYMSIEAELAASEREQTVTLHPKLVISGRVTDAETGRPVLKFRAVKGRKGGTPPRIAWSESMAIEVEGGQYSVSFDEGDVFLRIDAPGYKSAASRAFQANEGSQTFDFALHSAKGYSGLVLLPDGKPATRAEVALATQEQPVSIRSGRFDRNWDFPKTSVGPDGRFTFPSRDGEFLLVAVSEAGYADASSDEFAKTGKLVLQSWGRIEGGVRIGPRFGSDQEVLFQPHPPNRAYFWSFGYRTRTDERGQFRFDWVIPGSGMISRTVVTKLGGGANKLMPGWRESVEVKPGQTVQVTIGGTGRPVIGRIVLDGIPESPIDWTRNEPVELGWAASKLDKDGRFRIEDVISGQHTLDVRVNAPSHGAGGPVIGRAKRDFTVPEIPGGRSNEPLDLGTITVKLDALQIGELAPDFDVERIGTPEKGRRLKLGDYRGKLVLLNFWEAYWGADNPQGDMTVLKDVQRTFGSDPRFVLISLACAKDAAQAEGSIKESGLSWTHGFIGDLVSGVAPRYKIRAFEYMVFNGLDKKQRRVPLTFLIGPDGRILAHDLRGTDLEAVSKALNDDKVFPAAIRTTQPASSR